MQNVAEGGKEYPLERPYNYAQPAFTNDAKAIAITLQTDMAGLSAKVKEFTLQVPLAPECIIGKAGE